ncbi:MAG: outer membrane lipoprotein-sorting protein, partial [Candidatus Binatia bacterium]|nr:outer membrane lipoprotein-sorting protein [Candidatus Binatia bacterium]
MVRFSIGLFLLCWVMLPALSQGAPPGAIIQGEYIDVSEKTWQQYPEPIASPMGHPTRPWQPVGEFPWKEWGTPEKPYTATMLMYLGLDHDLYTTKYQDYSGISARMHKRGLLVQRKFYVMRETLYDSMLDVMQYDEDTASDKLGNSNIGLGKVGAGEMVNKRVLIYETPADVRGLGQVKNLFLNSPMTGWRMADAWTYSPGLRRVTRSQGGDRQDEILGTPVTLDDVGSREIWEEEHLLIGEDVVYDQMLDPQFIAPDRYENTGDFVKDGEWLARNLSRDRGELNMSPYRADGGVECWVILSKWATKTKDSM